MSSAWTAWSLELRGDELADLAYDGVVVLRAVQAVVRDRNWDTARTVVESVTEAPSALELRVRFDDAGSSHIGSVRLQADGGQLTVEFDLRAEHTFETNRTGLVVLHPPSLAGAALFVTHADGNEEAARFPRTISAHQPVRDIAALAWSQAGLDVRIRFEGDVFEMEDQRNWTDASYKTYSRPLDLPFPYTVEREHQVRQVLRIAVTGTAAPPVGPEPARIVLRSARAAPPSIGVGAATAADPGPAAATAADHLLVELDLATANWRAALGRAAATGFPLDVRFILDQADPDGMQTAVAALVALPVVRVSAFHAAGPAAHLSDAEAIERLGDALQATGLDLPIVGGTRAHFTELNREHHRLPARLGGVVFSVTPLFHARSTEQLVESIAMQRLVAELAVAIAGGRPVHIVPITLRPRFNNVATNAPPTPEHDDLREGYGPHLVDADDARQSAPELAAWTVASAAALAVPGVSSLTYFEEWGPRGLRSAAGLRFAAADAIDALRGLAGREGLVGPSPDGLVWALGARGDDGDTVLIANLDERHRDVLVTTPDGEWSTTVPPLTWIRVRCAPGVAVTDI
ncbi:MAG: D-apionolactonase [Microbacteriaceae bacterium]|nr:D-apionolactonase [Microbacteriaceae bacterium]